MHEAVVRLMNENGALRLKNGELARELVAARLSAMEYREGNICIFDDVLPEAALRELVNGAVGSVPVLRRSYPEAMPPAGDILLAAKASTCAQQPEQSTPV